MSKYNKLEIVEEKARRAGVCFEMNFGEADGSFYFVISSAAKSECWVGKSRPFDTAVLCVIEWLDGLIG